MNSTDPLPPAPPKLPQTRSGAGAQGAAGTTFGTACGGIAVLMVQQRLPGLTVNDGLLISAFVAIPAAFVGTVLSVILTAAAKALVKKLGGNPDDIGGGS